MGDTVEGLPDVEERYKEAPRGLLGGLDGVLEDLCVFGDSTPDP